MKTIDRLLCRVALLAGVLGLALAGGCFETVKPAVQAGYQVVTNIINGQTVITTNAVPVTPPASTNAQPATNAPPITAGGSKAALFVDASGSTFSETINSGATSGLNWVSCHGKSWENDYRADLLNRLNAAGSRWLVYIVDSHMPASSPVLRMCIADMEHPADGHHMVADEGWYERSIAKGVDSHIAILQDSPDSGVPYSQQASVDLVAAYKGTRYREVCYMTGLETKRNNTVAQAAQRAKWLQAAAPGKRVIVGDQSADFLLAVADASPGVELWLEQAAPGGNPINRPLTAATKSAYLADLARLAAKVGASKTWAGEWFMASVADARAFSSEVLALGYNCAGRGQFK